MTLAAVLAAAGLASCSTDGDQVAASGAATTIEAPGSAVPAAEPSSTEPTATPTTAPATGDADSEVVEPTTAAGVEYPMSFEQVAPGGDCQCADGSEFSYWVRAADPSKVLLFFQGGGACFSADTCSFANGTYKVTTDADDDPSGEGGIFDLGDARNPFRDWSMVYVPYCTGDVHLGDATTDYGGGLEVQHKGAVNGRAAVDELAARFPDAAQVVVAGESAGSVPTPLYAGLVADQLPDTRITVLADGSGAYPDEPVVNTLIGGLWGTERAIPDWPVNDGLTAADWSFPDLFVQAGRHAPSITFARHDYAFDQTQGFFAALAGVGSDDLVSLIDRNEQQIEDAGVPLLSFIAAGTDHTVLGSPRFYDETTEGVSLLDWVTSLVAGEPVEDVHCTTCGP